MGKTTDYFREKKPWSYLKDALLECYLPPYLAKIAKREQKVCVIDCFAGKGKFDDGSDGSPLIIADAIRTCLSRKPKSQIESIFIERKYAGDLGKNLGGYPYCEVVEGRFEDNFERFRKICRRASVLLYIDPYGINSLDSLLFRELIDISKRLRTSFEMLLNLNTMGFLREGCRLIKPSMDLSDFDDSDELYEDEIESKEKMNRIAGGSFWEGLVRDYYNGKINFAQLENRFTRGYLEHIGVKMGWKGFNYVLETPIKAKNKNVPKYRMIFGTNHVDGAILMADNMNKRWNQFLRRDRGGQMLLFDFLVTTEGKEFSPVQIDDEIMRLIQKHGEVCYKEMLVTVWAKLGIAVSQKEIADQIRGLATRGELKINREPPSTSTGKKPKSLDHRKYRITLKKGSGKEVQTGQKQSTQMSLFE
jgi:three-Cys-motif partner protein